MTFNISKNLYVAHESQRKNYVQRDVEFSHYKKKNGMKEAEINSTKINNNDWTFPKKIVLIERFCKFQLTKAFRMFAYTEEDTFTINQNRFSHITYYI